MTTFRTPARFAASQSLAQFAAAIEWGLSPRSAKRTQYVENSTSHPSRLLAIASTSLKSGRTRCVPRARACGALKGSGAMGTPRLDKLTTSWPLERSEAARYLPLYDNAPVMAHFIVPIYA